MTGEDTPTDARSPELRQQSALQEQAEIIAGLHRDLNRAWETNGALLLQLTGLQKREKALVAVLKSVNDAVDAYELGTDLVMEIAALIGVPEKKRGPVEKLTEGG